MASHIDSQYIQPEFEVEKKGNVTIVKIPETYVDKSLTEEQKEKLLQFEEEFKYRYTDEDEDYVANVKLGSIKPPLVSSYTAYNYKKDYRRGEKRSWEDPANNRNGRNYHNKQKGYNNSNDNRR